MKKLAVQQFIEQHSDWEKLLQEKPYCMTISRDKMFGRNLVMLKYSQIGSDFKNEIVRECRGLILDEDTFEPVCVPFFKFGNYGESYCPEIDWKSCWVGEKLDGSLIKIVRIGNNLLWSTNGTIDAFKAPLAEQIGCLAKSFGELAWWAVVDNWRAANSHDRNVCVDPDAVNGWLRNLLEEGHTYMFELTSPYNKVVVSWHETKLNFLGVRDNSTLQETYFSDHMLNKIFNVPKVFPLKSIDDCVKAAEKLDCNNEGFVVCDKNFNRVKVKSPTYVALHHMKNNNVLSYARGIEIVRGNELDEVLTYFPEFAEHLHKIKADYEAFVAELMDAQAKLDAWIASNGFAAQKWLIQSGGEKRKDLAIWVMSNVKKFSGFAFGYVDEKTKDASEYLKSQTSDKLAIVLGYKD